MTMVIRNETRMIVESSRLSDMSITVTGDLQTSRALELSPRHSHTGNLFGGRKELRDVDHRDEEEPIRDRVRNETKVLALHADSVERGGHVEHREQRPPVEHA